jgi:hypothetical protein
MSMVMSTVAAVEADDQASETLEPATDALEEQGESMQFPPSILVLPLTERLLGGDELPKDVKSRKSAPK